MAFARKVQPHTLPGALLLPLMRPAASEAAASRPDARGALARRGVSRRASREAAPRAREA